MKISIKQYAQTLFELTNGKSEQEVLDIVKNFATTLKKDGQLKNSANIIKKFNDIYNAAHEIIEAEVVTVKEIDKKIKDKVERFIKEKYEAKEVVIKNIIDENIKGGIVIRVGDEVMDSSVNNQLNKLKKVLQS